MLKLEFTTAEIQTFKKKIKFKPIEERVIEYRQLGMSIVEMSFKEHCSERTISRIIESIGKKISKII